MEIPKERKCTKCGETKPLTDEFFYPQKGYKYGLTRWCRDCRNKYSTELNKEKRNEYRANNARINRGLYTDKFRVREFAREMKKYGTTVEWYREKLIEQLGLCAMCGHLSHHHGTIQRLQVDHDHNCCDLHTKSCGKCLRGLLCADCNLKLAPLEKILEEMFTLPEPSPGTWLEKSLEYLRKWKEIHKKAQETHSENKEN